MIYNSRVDLQNKMMMKRFEKIVERISLKIVYTCYLLLQVFIGM